MSTQPKWSVLLYPHTRHIVMDAPLQRLGEGLGLRGKRVAVLLSVGIIVCCALPGHAADPVAPIPPVNPVKPALIQLSILPLRDAGGLMTDGAKVPLYTQLTQGLTTYLADAATGRYAIQSPDPKLPAPTFTLEGDLSHTQSNAPDGGPYLCVLRLYREGTPRRLVHQWAASARTYLDISSNLSHDARVNNEGLLGDLADRVVTEITQVPVSDQIGPVAALVANGSALKRLTAEVVPDVPTPVVLTGTPSLKSGDRYRVKVTSQDSGTVYAISLDAAGKPTGLFVPSPDQEIKVEAGRPAIVPGAAPIQTGEVTVPTDRTIIALVRRTPEKPRGDSISFKAPAPTKPAAVQVIDCGTSDVAPALPDAGVARILDMVAHDPKDTWLAQTVTVHIMPAQTPPPTVTVANLYVLAVGVNGKSGSPLYAHADADAVAKALQTTDKSLFGKVQIQMLFDHDASNSAIAKAIKVIGLQAQPSDTFCFFYSGKGELSADQKMFLVTSDVPVPKKGHALDVTKGLSAQTLKTLCAGLTVAHQFVAIDASHAGYVTDAFQDLVPRASATSAASVTVLAAANESGLAFDQDALGHGFFTAALLAGLGGAADDAKNPDGTISASELSQYLTVALPKLNARQVPVTAAIGDDFPVVMHAH